jgi:hypothetical protein
MASERTAVTGLDPAWVACVDEVQQQAQRVLHHLDVTEQPAFWQHRTDLLEAVAEVMKKLAGASMRINAHFQAIDWNADPEAGQALAADVAARMERLRATVEELNRRLINIRKLVSERAAPGVTVV